MAVYPDQAIVAFELVTDPLSALKNEVQDAKTELAAEPLELRQDPFADDPVR